MARLAELRTGEAPMEFEWTAKPAVDPSSPFAQVSQHLGGQKRPHSSFESPNKNNSYALRPPNSKPFLFSQQEQQQQSQSRPSSLPKFGQPAFMTPRKIDVDFSSGAENFSSPENADNEDTPEQPARTERRNSIFNPFGRHGHSSPGRGEITRVPHFASGAVHKVQKRRLQRDKVRDKELIRRVKVESDDESDGSSNSQKRGGKLLKRDNEHGSEVVPSRMSSFREFFALLEAHPNVPSILSWWAQLLVNLSLFSLAVWIVFTFVSAIRAEFEHAAEEVSDGILADMAKCAKDYVDNKCGGGDRLPALETVCENWERCMNRDPAKVGRAKVSAHTMAVIINNFIDPISWKAVLIFLATISTVTVVSNWSFRSFRNKHNQQDYSHHPNNYPGQPQGHNPFMHGQPLPLQHNPGFSYYGQQQPDLRQERSDKFSQKQDAPLMLENARAMDYVRERSRDPDATLRSPSPSKSKRRFA
ncbi:nuclear envelope protein Brr6 [Penicillium angulare]|uniref:nuclear envelope protein Brr6 n=1 Tax=Penicillium angulare TaxID=116970 RepID=UPI0025410091|nr:nuclear envelope protein Brr6 [Penicillium angulare]KAJ5261136.1 nuclear envelope protein Brr6 [Penicillium angulare]